MTTERVLKKKILDLEKLGKINPFTWRDLAMLLIGLLIGILL
jgi:hypothetical protein